MMKRLLLLRHAKSSWADESMDDHDRPLNERGRRDAPRMGQVLAGLEHNIDLTVCSTANRACETLAAAGLAEDGPELIYDDRLYHAAPSVVRAVLRDIAEQHDTVLLIGHNPGMEDLASSMAGDYIRMPTATLVCLDLEIRTWADFDVGTKAVAYKVWRPKEL